MNDIFNKIFPKQLNNNYNGSLFSKYIFILLTVITVIRSLVHMFFLDGGAQSIASIPLDTYSVPAMNVVVLIFSFWGSSQLLISFIYILAIFRYQNMIPILYILMFLEYLIRFVFGHLKPIILTDIAPGSIANEVMIPLTIFLLYLSLRERK